ncbi:MAG: RDD family protein [Blastocatellia bacterium]|nr:RDD family protein [Blastocatellia bacterium]
MPFCPRCGTQANDWDPFCQQCSSPLPNRPSSPPYGSQPPAPQPQPPSPPSYNAPEYGGYQQPVYGGGYGAAAPTGSYAGVGKRFAAVFIDGLLVSAAGLPGIIIFFIGAAMAGSRSTEEIGAIFGFLGWLLAIAGYLGLFIYNIYLLGRDGATLGKRWMKIKVIDNTGQPLGFGKAFLRELVKSVVGNVCFILLFWPLWDQEQQGLYDKLFDTHVYDA